MLTKNVDGVDVVMSAEEEAVIRAHWAEEDLKRGQSVIKNKVAVLQKFLQDSDWYIIRFIDTGVAVPEDVKNERQAAREEINRLLEEKEQL